MASVLLAAGEESTSSRVVARLALEAAGHTVQEVHDGQSALAQAEASRPDLLVLDTDLPVYDGFQVLERLRRHPALRHLPVVIISTIPRMVGGELARSLGAFRYLGRPFTNADLDAAVRAALTAPARGASPLAANSAAWPPTAPWRASSARASYPPTVRGDGAAPGPPSDGLVELPAAVRRRRPSAPRRPLRRA